MSYVVSKKKKFRQTFPLRTKKWRLDEDSALLKGKKSEKSRTILDWAFLMRKIGPNTFQVPFIDIRYSTPKMIPIINSFLQPISKLSGIGVSTIPNHRGPHQSPKTTTNTPKKQLFP